MLMRILDAWHEASPLRRLAVGTLVLIVLAQAIAMAMLSESQVRKAQAFYADQRAQPDVQSAQAVPTIAQPVARPAAPLAASASRSASAADAAAEPGTRLVNPAYAVAR